MNCSDAGFKVREDGLGHCNYCGSLSVGDTIRLLKTPGTEFSGSDWKYGWPHKFYLGKCKFYSVHLQQASEEEVKEFDRLSRKIFGIAWAKDEKGVKYQSPKTSCSYGWQRFGEIHADGTPAHQDGKDSAAIEIMLSDAFGGGLQ